MPASASICIPLAIHANYLVNLASCDPVIRARSIASFRGELERAAAIGAEYLVLHPGSYKGQSLEEGIAAFVAGPVRCRRGRQRKRQSPCCWKTRWDAARRSEAASKSCAPSATICPQLADLPVGYCLDTCHLLAAGYDVSCAAGLRETVAQADRILGIGNIKLIHANDSKTPLASHTDRHANIGEGHIGNAGFRRILTHPKLRSKPFILETPVAQDGDDRRNLENLKKLCPKGRTTTTKSS